jgi:hypothetical protein
MCIAAHGKPKRDDLHAAHSCGNPQCVNPKHIRWATPAENNQDKILHGTTNEGERHGNAKLTEKDVLEIRASRETLEALSARYNVSISVLSNVRNRKAWRHV